MQLIFDPGWCVRKVDILQSSKYWRLDEISLHWAITTKWKPAMTKFTPEGEPTVTIPLAWQAPGMNR